MKFTNTLPDEVKEHRNNIVLRAMFKHYTKDEISKVLTNRRSDFSDKAVIEDFFKTERPKHDIPRDANYLEALQVTKENFEPKEKLRPVSFPDLRYYPWNLVPSAEAPWNLNDFLFVPFQSEYDWTDPQWNQFKRKPGKPFRPREWLRYKQAIGLINDDTPNFHNLYNELFVYNRTLVHQIKYGFDQFWSKNGTPVTYYWNTLHSRSHVVANNEPDKIRAVFGAPKLLLMVENMFIWQLQRSYLNNDEGCMLWGREIMKGGWRKLWNEINDGRKTNSILSIDWKGFDRGLLFELMSDTHDIWKSYFNFTQYEPTSFYPNGRPKDDVTLERLWKWMCYSILHNPILLPDGRLFKWTYSGFGSGYQQTQLMGSFCNMIMLLTCLSSLGINIKSEHFWIKIQGDDSLISLAERVFIIYGPNFLTQLADSANYYFAATINTKKSKISGNLNDVSVLGYFNTYGIPYRTDEDLLRHLYFPEHDQDWTRLAASSLGLAMASCGCSLRFYNTCRDIWNKLTKKYGVTPNFRALKWMERANMIERSEALIGVDFPSITVLQAEVWSEPRREKSSKQRLWPTEPGPAGRFYFLKSV